MDSPVTCIVMYCTSSGITDNGYGENGIPRDVNKVAVRVWHGQLWTHTYFYYYIGYGRVGAIGYSSGRDVKYHKEIITNGDMVDSILQDSYKRAIEWVQRTYGNKYPDVVRRFIMDSACMYVNDKEILNSTV